MTQQLLKNPIPAWIMEKICRRYAKLTGKPLPAKAINPAVVSISEVTPLPPTVSTCHSHRRINLIVPALSEEHLFGGIATALRCFDKLRAGFDGFRIIVSDETHPKIVKNAFYSNWLLTDLDTCDTLQPNIVAAGHRANKMLAVHSGDVFMATAWWTAHLGYAIINWQNEIFADSVDRKLIYLIQDFEPGFYPWSSRYALAEASYRKPNLTHAIFNTKILAEFFSQNGFAFSSKYILEPRLHPKLTEIRNNSNIFKKERRILVYGRPGTDRNVFGLIVAGLKTWSKNYPHAKDWIVCSAGESFESIPLGNGCTLENLGKLNIDQYSLELARSSVGLSLMLSPHPSYPPLEMCAHGILTITNKFANKDLSSISDQLINLLDLSPENISNSLSYACLLIDNKIKTNRYFTIETASIKLDSKFLVDGQETDSLNELAAHLI
ncbi:MAG: hypothetical protein AB9M53_04500 [Leptothrix sp. (in: b-proteobacteria)]